VLIDFTDPWRGRRFGRVQSSSRGRVHDMNYRRLGITGIKVTPLCPGAMMFRQIGNNDHHDSVRIIHRALNIGIYPIDTAGLDNFSA
jgi:hypothetical protein